MEGVILVVLLLQRELHFGPSMCKNEGKCVLPIGLKKLLSPDCCIFPEIMEGGMISRQD